MTASALNLDPLARSAPGLPTDVDTFKEQVNERNIVAMICNIQASPPPNYWLVTKLCDLFSYRELSNDLNDLMIQLSTFFRSHFSN